MIDINKLIISATKERNPALSTYKLIKAEFLLWEEE